MNPDEVTVQEMKQALADPALGIQVIDVREPNEYDIARVADVPLYPLGDLPRRFTELDPTRRIYGHCKSGVRSLKAVKFLQDHGFKYARSVKGGILAWSNEIDPRVPQY